MGMKNAIIHNMTDHPVEIQLPSGLTSGKELLQQSWSSKMSMEVSASDGFNPEFMLALNRNDGFK